MAAEVELSERVWRTSLLSGALIIWPIIYAAVASRMRSADLPSRPRLELFVGFGILGGWMLTVALSPSGLSVICAVGLYSIATPAAMYLWVRLACRQRRSRFDSFAMILLAIGAAIPFVGAVLAAN